jgi:hypothetical protein
LLLALRIADVLHGGTKRDQLLLRLVPVALIDQLLHLVELLRGKRHRLVAGLGPLAEQRASQPIERIAWLGVEDDRAETAKAQHRSRHPPNDGQRKTVAARRFLRSGQRHRRLRHRDHRSVRSAADIVSPIAQHRGQWVHRRHPGAGSQRIDEAVGAYDRVEAGVVVRHSLAPPR